LLQDRRRTHRARRPTDHVLALATTARLKALDLARMRWEAAYRFEIKALEGVGIGATPGGSQGWLESTLRSVAATVKRTIHGQLR